MLKKWIALLLCALPALLFTACPNGGPHGVADEPQPNEPARRIEILDENGARLGGIDARAAATAADTGVFYSIFERGETDATAPAEYRFFRASDGKDVRLGTLENQGYEALYARTQLDGAIYALAVTGNPFDDAPDPLLLLRFDPAKETMETYEITKNGFPYASMAAVNGKLLIMNHEMTAPQRDALYAFDPAEGSVTQVLSFDAAADSLRGVSAAENGFYLLRLHLENAAAELFLDRYDGDGAKRGETSLSGLLTPALTGIRGILSAADAETELRMNVSRFAVSEDRYLVYENFGLVRLVFDLETKEALFAEDDNYAASVGGGTPAFYFYDLGQAGEYGLKTGFFELRGGEVVNRPFSAPGEAAHIVFVSDSPAGTRLVRAAQDDGETEVLYLFSGAQR